MATWTMNHPPRPLPLEPEQLAVRRAAAHRRYLLSLGPKSRADVLARMAAKHGAASATMNPDGSVSYEE